MAKQKIADSIIIRVGGGIREIPREPVEIAESRNPVPHGTDFEQTEDMHPFGGEPGAPINIGPDSVK